MFTASTAPLNSMTVKNSMCSPKVKAPRHRLLQVAKAVRGRLAPAQRAASLAVTLKGKAL
jgi:hypothetical protein